SFQKRKGQFLWCEKGASRATSMLEHSIPRCNSCLPVRWDRKKLGTLLVRNGTLKGFSILPCSSYLPRRWNRKKLSTLLVRNGTLKVFSLAFACGLWLLVNAGERDTEKTLVIPVELSNLPPQLVVIGGRVDSVDLRARGPRTLLGRFRPKKITLNLSGVRPGP